MRAAWLLAAASRRDTSLTWLQLIAAFVTTVLGFSAAILAAAFLSVPTDEIGYPILAISLIGFVAVPIVTLGTAAARLTARSRDDRLATLRLLGVSSARVRVTALVEVTVVAAVGVVAGTLASLALPLALTLLPVYGSTMSAQQLWLPVAMWIAIPLLLIVVATVSALLGLRRVVMAPLGVRIRRDAPRLSWIRVLVAFAVIAGAAMLTQLVSPDWGLAVVAAALALGVLAVMSVLGLAGPWIVAIVAKARGSRTSDGARLVAMQGIVDDPKASWRQVSAVALTSFIMVPAVSMIGYLSVIQSSQSSEIMTEDQHLVFDDARTMLLAAIVIAFLVTACQVAITQAAGILERRELYIALNRLGIPRASLMKTRRAAVMLPTLVAVLGSALAATALSLLLVIMLLVMAPLFAASLVVLLTAGILLLLGGVSATRPVLTRVLTAPQRGE